MRNRLWAGVALLVLVVLGVLAALGLRPVDPVSTSAPATEFSAERAIARLGPITAAFHPAGSPANTQVRDFVLGQLRGLGLDPTTDARVAGRPSDHRSHVVGTVTDIHAHIPGSAPTGRIILAAHYDSVPDGPGAADDGSNVVSILEIVRALRSGPPLRNDLEILITDGEEAGLLGAKAYVDGGGAHDKDRTVVLNMEARGSSGPAIMFQSVGGNAGLMPAVGAGDALATSVSDDVYKLLPNDTDLTVFDEAGLRGLNYAFVGGSVNYHTPHDDPAHLSHATVQAMGNAVLAAARDLGAADLGALPGRNDSYFTVFGLFVHYPAWLVLPLALLALVAFVLSIMYLRPSRFWLGFGSFLLPVLGAGVVGFGVWYLLTMLRPEYLLFEAGDTNRPLWYALGMSLLTVTLLALWYRWLRRRASVSDVALVVLGWLTLLAVVTAFLVPGGSYVFTWPVLIGCVALVAARRWAGEDSAWPVLAAAAAAVPAVVLGLPMVLLLFPLVGIALAVAPLAMIVIFGATALALLSVVPGRVLTIAMVTAVVAGIALVGVGLGVDEYNPQYPRPVSLGYGVDGNTNTAYWISAGAPDDPVTRSVLSQRVSLPQDAFPVLGTQSVIAGAAQPSPTVAVPTVDTVRSTNRGDGTREVRLRLRAGPSAHRISVYANGKQVLGATADGVRLPGGPNVAGTSWGMTYAAPPATGVELTMTVRGTLSLNVTAMYPGLPPGGPTLTPDASWVLMSPLANQSFAVLTVPL